MLDIKLLSISVTELQGSLPNEIISVGVYFTSKYEVTYFFLTKEINDYVESEIEEILHDILTEAGVRHIPPNRLGFKFTIDYKMTTNKVDFINKANYPMYILYLLPEHLELKQNTKNRINIDISNISIYSMEVFFNQILLGNLESNENFILKEESDNFRLTLRLKNQEKYLSLFDYINEEFNNLQLSNKLDLELKLIN
ncbi:hypothetical protein NACSLCCMFF_120078 [Tenacibaculum maritimum]|uniref:hypothetical protein n=1 Tax=Tenacibaculum maritimum TaxID=107401 RepID=UPI0012E619F4|nr:hypothetical protein [Tenacibaculum maritimum]CAA0160452.1 hypothetical protein NACSLCCMFF_120078 [Tenacibaculum maritimum]